MNDGVDWIVSIRLPGNTEIVRYVRAPENEVPPASTGTAANYLSALSKWSIACGHEPFRIHLCVDPVLIEVVRR